MNGGVADGDGDRLGFILTVYGISCCRYVELDFVKGIGKISEGSRWGMEKL